MFAQSLNPTIAASLLAGMLAAMLTRPGAALMSALKVHLYTAGPSPIKPIQAPTDFTEATFTGYAAVTLAALSGPIITPRGTCEALFGNASFVATGATPANTILGYWLDDGSTNFFAGEAFPTPIPIAAIGNFIDLAVILGLTYVPNY
jgi:hypothetical protein